MPSYGKVRDRQVLGGYHAPVPDRRKSSANTKEPKAQDLPHEDLRQERRAGQVSLLVFHEALEQGKEEWW